MLNMGKFKVNHQVDESKKLIMEQIQFLVNPPEEFEEILFLFVQKQLADKHSNSCRVSLSL